MPELPEAEVTARQLRTALLGARIAHIQIGRADIVREGLPGLDWYAGSTVRSVERRGKSVILELEKADDVRYFVAELGMTGLLLFPSAPVRFPHHTHAVVTFEDESRPTLRYWNPRRFGRLSLLDRDGLDRYLARRFGCDPLTVTPQELARLLHCRRRLKPLLMHQQTIAGIGNIYANEILFRAKLHPNAVAGRMKSAIVDRLHRIMQTVLREAIEAGGSSVKDYFAPDGSEGRYKQRHLVYAKAGQRCPNRCGAVIRRLQSERSSFYCPRCQDRRRNS